MDGEVNIVKLIKYGVGGAAALITASLLGCNSTYTVEQGERGVHTSLGALKSISQPGFHLKTPFLDDVKRLPIRNQTTEWKRDGKNDSRMESYSRDQQPANIAATVTWEPLADDVTITKIFTTYGSVEALWNAVVVPKTTEAVKNVFGTYDAVTVIQNRAKFNADVAAELQRLSAGYPVKITSVQIQDISFSEAYEAAVEARMKAQVEVQKAEQEKQTSQIEADMRVIKAEAAAKETRLAGEAEAAAIKARSEALASSPKLVELTLAEKWDGHLPQTMVPGQTVPFLNVK